MPRRREPLWISRLVLDAVHFDLLRSYGGLAGIRDENALESALSRPRQRWAYSHRTDLAGLAAAYGYAFARNHPYRDGNKRIAFMAMAVFLGLNGYELEAAESEVVTIMLRLAGGRLTERALTSWVRKHMQAYSAG